MNWCQIISSSNGQNIKYEQNNILQDFGFAEARRLGEPTSPIPLADFWVLWHFSTPFLFYSLIVEKNRSSCLSFQTFESLYRILYPVNCRNQQLYQVVNHFSSGCLQLPPVCARVLVETKVWKKYTTWGLFCRHPKVDIPYTMFSMFSLNVFSYN